jgi:outer membrane protein assembly factor BamD (BamD/ComL family)
MKLYCTVIATVLLCVCCTSQEEKMRQEANQQGGALIEQARAAYHHEKYDEAIELIDSIRHAYPTAMNAREEGILLKDSIEIAKAEVELQTLMQQGITTGEDVEEAQRKIKYFVRKLSHDIEQRGTH